MESQGMTRGTSRVVAGLFAVLFATTACSRDEVEVREQRLEPTPVQPVLDCVWDFGPNAPVPSRYRAYWGYDNGNDTAITVPIGMSNSFSPGPQNRGQVETFAPGKHTGVFSTAFDGTLLTWSLQTLIATASLDSPRCARACGPNSCDDGNPCTADSCDAATGTCRKSNVPNGTPCPDDNACNGVETCKKGVCTSGRAAKEGTSCSDGNLCNGQETCRRGICRAGTPLTCAGGSSCQAVSCDPTLGCLIADLPDATPCEDGNLCTLGDRCVAGGCQPGTPRTCPATDACHLSGTCDLATGSCSNPVAPNGASCTDGNLCNGNETCSNGQCTPGTPAPNGSSCADANLCNGAEQCQSGQCVAAAPLPDGTSCADANVCNGFERCQGGQCLAGTPLVCPRASECTGGIVPYCSPTSGCMAPTPPGGNPPCGCGGLCGGMTCYAGTALRPDTGPIAANAPFLFMPPGAPDDLSLQDYDFALLRDNGDPIPFVVEPESPGRLLLRPEPPATTWPQGKIVARFEDACPPGPKEVPLAVDGPVAPPTAIVRGFFIAPPPPMTYTCNPHEVPFLVELLLAVDHRWTSLTKAVVTYKSLVREFDYGKLGQPRPFVNVPAFLSDVCVAGQATFGGTVTVTGHVAGVGDLIPHSQIVSFPCPAPQAPPCP